MLECLCVKIVKKYKLCYNISLLLKTTEDD